MADDVLASFMVALGFKVDTGSQKAAAKSVADYEKAVVAAEEAIEKARWDGAKTEEEVARLSRETNLKLAKEALEKAKQVEREQERGTRAFAENEKKKNKAQAEATAFAIAKFNLLIAAVQEAARAASSALTGTVTGFNHLYYVSGRTGASVGNLKALGHAFEQTGGSASEAISAVETFTQAMRTNPGVKGFVDNLGVDKSLDGVEKLIAVVDKLNATQRPEIAQAQATGILGLSVEQYNQFTLQGREIKKQLEDRRAFARSIGFDEQAGAEASKNLSQALGSISMMAEVTFQRVLVDVMPRLTGWIEKVRLFLRDHQKDIKEWVDWAEEKIRAFATAVEGYFKEGVASGFKDLFGEDLGKKLDRFNERLSTLATTLKTIADSIRFLAPYFKDLFTREAVPGLGTGVTAYRDAGHQLFGAGAGSGAEPADQRSFLEKVLPKRWGGKDAPGTDGIHRRGRRAEQARLEDAGDGSKAPIGGQTFRDKAPGVMRRLMEDFSLNKEEAAVVLGNLGHESAGFKAFEEGGGGPGRGWAQWTDPGRKRRFFEYAEKNKLDPKSDEANYGFLKWELKNTHRSSIERLKQAQGRGEKMRQFEQGFEGAGVKAYGSRNRYADEAERAFDAEEKRKAAPGASTAPVQPVVPPKSPADSIRGLPNMPPGGFDPNRIDPKNLMQPAPAGASPVTNNTSSTSKAVSQSIVNNVKVEASNNPREHGRIMESSLSRVHGLALANAQTAVV